MRILMTADTVGGVWTYAVELCRGLRGWNCEIVLATMGALPSAEQRAQIAALPNVTLRPSAFKLEWMDDPWSHVARAGEWLLKIEEEERPDVIHLNGYVHGALPWRAPALVAGHSCVLSWWKAVKGIAAPGEWRHYAAQVQRGLAAAHIVVAPSHAMAAALHEHYGPLERAVVIPNGLESSRFVSLAKEPFVLSVGRLWDEAKNTRALAAVAPHLDWPIAVAGETRARNNDDPAWQRLELLGRCDAARLRELYGRAAIYAMPAKYEPFGLSILEAAHSRCALVLGDIESLRENWNDAAEFVPPDDHEALHATLTRLIHDGARREQLAESARRRAAEFTTARMAGSHAQLYSAIVAEARERARQSQLSFAAS